VIFLSDLTKGAELYYAQVMQVHGPSETFLVRQVIFTLARNGLAQLGIVLKGSTADL